MDIERPFNILVNDEIKKKNNINSYDLFIMTVIYLRNFSNERFKECHRLRKFV